MGAKIVAKFNMSILRASPILRRNGSDGMEDKESGFYSTAIDYGPR